MRVLLSFCSIFVIISCGPREDEKLQPTDGGNFDVVAGEPDLFANRELFKNVADGMTMTEGEGTAYINAAPQRNEVTFSYRESPDSKSGGSGSLPSHDEFELPKGQQVQVFGEGSKLETCAGEKDNDWGQIRLDSRLKSLFDKASEIKAQILRGSKNCYRISGKKALPLVLQREEDGPYENEDIHFLIKNILLINTSDFISNQEMLDSTSAAVGFAKSEDLVHYIKDDKGDFPSLVTITTLEVSDEQTPIGGGGPVFIFKLPAAKGLKAGDCQAPGKPTWKSMRIFPDQEDIFGEAFKNKTATAIVTNGDFNCLVIGENAMLAFKDTSNAWIDDPNLEYRVTEVVIRDKADFFRDGKLTEFVASEAGMSVDVFLTYLETLSQARVNITRLEWVQ